MAWKLALSAHAERDLRGFDHAMADWILRKLEWFAENFENTPHERLHGRLAAFQKLRVGDFRVIYSVEYTSATLRVKAVDRRDKIYKPKKRK